MIWRQMEMTRLYWVCQFSAQLCVSRWEYVLDSHRYKSVWFGVCPIFGSKHAMNREEESNN